MKAKEASSTAPASLTGLRIADRDPDADDAQWLAEKSKSSQNNQSAGKMKSSRTDVDGSIAGNGAEQIAIIAENNEHKNDEDDDELLSPPQSPHLLTTSVVSIDALSTSSAISSKPHRSGRGRSMSTALTPTPARLSVSTQALSASEAALSSPMTSTLSSKYHDAGTAAVLKEDASSSLALTRGTIELLLSQLTDMHDRQQAAQKAEWDVFIRRRRRAIGTSMAGVPQSSTAPKLLFSQSSSVASSAAAMLGFSRSPAFQDEDAEVTQFSKSLVGVAQLGFGANKEDWKEFTRLVRAGIPLTYRAKIWSECCGANEAAEPGVFQDLLFAHQDESHPTLSDIEKDVKRTSQFHSIIRDIKPLELTPFMFVKCQQIYSSEGMA